MSSRDAGSASSSPNGLPEAVIDETDVCSSKAPVGSRIAEIPGELAGEYFYGFGIPRRFRELHARPGLAPMSEQPEE